MITISVTYSRTEIPNMLMVKGKRVDSAGIRLYLDALIRSALEGAGMKWYSSGTLAVGDSLERDIEFDCDLGEIMSAPTELEINAELSKYDVIEKDVFVT